MYDPTRHSYARLALCLLGCMPLPSPSASTAVRAQIEPGLTDILQHNVPVGLVYVPRPAEACRYQEYWYLGPDYVYPGSLGPGQSVVTRLQYAPRQRVFVDAYEFYAFARAQMPGGKRVLVLASELDEGAS